MPIVTTALALIIFVAGVIAGAMGSLLGLAGGVFLVPFLNLGLNFSFPVAAAISLTTVIATSSSVSAVRSRSSHEPYSAPNVCNGRGSFRSMNAAVGTPARISHGVVRTVIAETATATG